MRKIATIVEGHSEVSAVPILLRRIAERTAPDLAVEVPRPIRVKRHQVLKHGKLERAVRLAALNAGPDGGILILLDADEDCPAELGPGLLHRALEAQPNHLIRVVLAKAEYEAWFLASAISLAGRRGVDAVVAPPLDPESIRNAKGWLSERMPLGQRYRETLHQAAFSAVFDLDAARTAPSFDKMWRDVGSLLGAWGEK